MRKLLVTEIHIDIVRNPKPLGLVAYVRLVLEHQLAIKQVQIIRTLEGLEVRMPQFDAYTTCPECNTHFYQEVCFHCGYKTDIPRRRRKYDVIHPTTNDLRAYLTRLILQEYERRKED